MSSDSEPDMIFEMEEIETKKKKLEDMEKDELLDIIKKDKENKKRYIKKYQQTEKGKKKTREASKKYYDANRAKILEKKRQAYLERKIKQKIEEVNTPLI
jgi:DNA repair photolyase